MEKTNGIAHRIFVGIDCLLDTRLAALGRHAPKVTTQLLISGAYHKRRHNVFSVLDETINDAEVERIYQTHDASLLKESMATSVVPLIGELVLRYKKMENKLREETDVVVDVNLWPYTLDAASKEAIGEAIEELTMAKRVKTVFVPLPNMTPGFLAQYNTVIWYDFNEWVNVHYESFKNKTMANVEFYCPEIYVKEDDDLEKIDPSMPATSLCLLFCEHVKLVILSLKEFSLYNPF